MSETYQSQQGPGQSTVGQPGAGRPYNQVHVVVTRGGWPALFAGDNQRKTVTKAVAGLNAQGLGVAAITPDIWGFWKRLWKSILAVITLGFVVHRQNLLIVTEPIR